MLKILVLLSALTLPTLWLSLLKKPQNHKCSPSCSKSTFRSHILTSGVSARDFGLASWIWAVQFRSPWHSSGPSRSSLFIILGCGPVVPGPQLREPGFLSQGTVTSSLPLRRRALLLSLPSLSRLWLHLPGCLG